MCYICVIYVVNIHAFILHYRLLYSFVVVAVVVVVVVVVVCSTKKNVVVDHRLFVFILIYYYILLAIIGEYFSMDDIFSFLIVRNSGHLLPMDIPRTALEMIRKFIHNEQFADLVLPNEISYEFDDLSQLQSTDIVVNKGVSGSFAMLFIVVVVVSAAIIGFVRR